MEGPRLECRMIGIIPELIIKLLGLPIKEGGIGPVHPLGSLGTFGTDLEPT